MKRRGARRGAWLLALLASATAASSELRLPEPGSPAWEPVHFRGIERPTRYDVVEVGGRPVFRAESHCGASGMTLALDSVDLHQTPRLAWRWRIETVPSRAEAAADEQSRSGDDFAARVSLLYRLDPDRASWLQRIQRRVAESWYGREMPGSAIEFVWARALPAGSRWSNPFQADAHMVAMSSGEPDAGESPVWQDIVLDLAEERRRAGHTDISPPVGLAIMSDSDNTCSQALAWFADFRLLPP